MALRDAFRLLDAYGGTHTFTRLNPPGPAGSAQVKAIQRRSEEMPLRGDVSQYDTQFYVGYDSLVSAGFPVPLLKGDRITDAESRVYVINSVEDMHDGQGSTAGYRVYCRGH